MLRRDEPHELVAERARRARAGRSVAIRLLYPEGSWANLDPVTTAFTAATGVEFVRVPVRVDETALHILTTTLARRQDWDVALPATFALPDLVAVGCLRDLTELAREHEPASIRAGMSFDVGDYHQDRLYGYQTDGDSYLVTYNRRLLEDDDHNRAFRARHGRDLGVARTWRELDEMMAFFAGADGGRHPSTLFRTTGYTAWEWWMRFASKGRLAFDGAFDPTIDSDEGVAALRELCAATSSQYGAAGSNGLFENWKAFGSGDYFCNLGWGGSQKALRGPDSAIRDDLLVASPPGADAADGPARIGYFNWGWNYCVGSGCAEAEIAYLFCLYAVCPEPSLRAVRRDGFFDPFRAEHYRDERIRSVYGAQFLAEHERSMAVAMPDLYLRGQTEYFDVLRRFVRAAAVGEIEPEVAMRTAADSWRRTTERLDVDSQQRQWASLLRRYPEALREFLR
ncbi:MAG: extracellular solute-binding protein [Planctomycetes bacterium]|nr:extracellular solute-binding protein [Planctomycetota bacterium]